MKCCVLCLLLSVAGCMAAPAAQRSAEPTASPAARPSAYFNKTKYRVLQRQRNVWLLYDPQLSQSAQLHNKLLVSGAGLANLPALPAEFTGKIRISAVSDGVLSFSGTIAELQQLQQWLSQYQALQIEWQIRYLPLKPLPEI